MGELGLAFSTHIERDVSTIQWYVTRLTQDHTQHICIRFEVGVDRTSAQQETLSNSFAE